MGVLFPNHTGIRSFEVYTFTNKNTTGIQRRNNVDSTLIQRQDVESTLNRLCFQVMCLLETYLNKDIFTVTFMLYIKEYLFFHLSELYKGIPFFTFVTSTRDQNDE